MKCLHAVVAMLQHLLYTQIYLCIDDEFSANSDKNDSSEGNTLSTYSKIISISITYIILYYDINCVIVIILISLT